MTSWAELSGFKRDLLITVGLINRDEGLRASGVVIIDEVRRRFDHSKQPESYYMALADLREADLLDVDEAGRKKYHELSPDAIRMLHRQNDAITDSVRVIAA